VKVRFWGTRGSLPAPIGAAGIRQKVRDALAHARGRHFEDLDAIDHFVDHELPFPVRGTFGGNSSCVQIETGGPTHLVCDLGSGARDLGQAMMARYGAAKPQHYDVFMSHVHWDHIMGLPFFTPAYIPGNTIRIHGCHTVLEEAFRRQQSDPCFPVHFDQLGAKIEFVQLEAGHSYDIGGVKVTTIAQHHHGDSFGYRFEKGGKTIVYSTDSEHKFDVLDETYPFVRFFRDADIVIFDAMYAYADAISLKEDWGHSSNIIAVELAHMAKVKRLVLFHHEPIYDDYTLDTMLGETMRFEEINRTDHELKVSSAYDGLELEA
jgi:phosphoribosyl 1,2-cyclic phosphodiesterase